MAKKILITGISGFIGQYLAKALISKGYEVRGIDKRQSEIGQIKIESADILDYDSLKEHFKDIDMVIHLAALTTHEELVNKTGQAIKVNVEGTKNILKAFLGSKAQYFIYPSSGKVYGDPKKLPYDEGHELNPGNLLGRLKKEIEEEITTCSRKSDKTFVIFRIFNVYGHKQRSYFLVPTILSQLDKETITLGDIEAKRDYIFIDDLIEAFLRVIDSNLHGLNIFNLGTGKSYSARDIVNMIGKIMDRDIKIEINQSKLRKNEPSEEKASIEKLKELGWEPRYSLEEGLRKTVEGFKKEC